LEFNFDKKKLEFYYQQYYFLFELRSLEHDLLLIDQSLSDEESSMSLIKSKIAGIRINILA